MQITFSLPPGVTTEDSKSQAAGRWYSSNNVRFWQGLPQSIGGWSKLFASALTGVPRKMLAFNRSGTATIAYATASKLYVGSGVAQPSDRTPVGYPTGQLACSLAPWGSTLLAAPKGGTLYEQSGTSTAAAVAAAPDEINSMIVTPQRQVMAGGCNEEVSGTFNALCIRWSDIEDYTDWTTAASGNAGEHVLDGAGKIVALRQVGAFIGVWTDNSLWIGSFVGDPGQTYRFDLVDDASGLAGHDAVEVIGGRAWWIKPDGRLVTWAPGEIPKTITAPVNITIGSAFDGEKVLVTSNSRYGEIWIHHGGLSGGGENSIANVLNIEANSWFRSNVIRTAVLDDGVLGDLTGGAYGSNIIGAASDGNVYIHEYGTTADGGNLSWSIESGQLPKDYRKRLMLRRFIPDFGSPSGTINLTIASASYPEELDSAESSTYDLSSVPFKKDLRKSGRMFSVGFAGTRGNVRIGPMTFDAVEMGER